MSWIRKIQNQPEAKRRAILWTITITIGVLAASFWIYSSYQKFQTFQKEKNEIADRLDTGWLAERTKELDKTLQFDNEAIEGLQDLLESPTSPQDGVQPLSP